MFFETNECFHMCPQFLPYCINLALLNHGNSYGMGWANFVIVSQLFAGSYLVFLLDELVSKWGIGSGMSLFIAAGVSQSTFVGTLSSFPFVAVMMNRACIV